jgi:phosphoglycerate dehydrogenase-like enzyme
LIGSAQFRAMKRSSYLVNIARGAIVVESEMRQALVDGEIAGAVVDVFEEEPLPPESDLWDVPNLLITPHSSYRSPKAPERGLLEFAENLNRFRNGEPLRNQLQDANLGY